MKHKEHFKKKYEVSSEVLEGEPRFLHESERRSENSIKHMRMSSAPPPHK